MKSSTFLALAPLALCAALLVGCSTPESRIKDSPAVFNSLPPEQQDLVKAGKVAPGFSMDAVKLSIGDPDHITVHTDATGSHQIWHYVTYEDYQGGVIYAGYWHRYRGWGGPFFYGGVPYYDGYPARVHDRIRVVFGVNNLVTSIEEEKP
jgi:outer membrane protein assembly factor BamE (lipoprotein component of BamABCDE complex)